MVRERQIHIEESDTPKKKGQPMAYEDSEQLSIAIDNYFTYCDEQEPREPYTMSGLAYFLGISRITLLNYEKLYQDKGDYFVAIKKARQRVEYDVERRMANGTPATGLIFNLKNNFGWKDQQQLDVTSNGQTVFDGEALRVAAQEYLKEPDDESGETDNTRITE
jgi:hypothetical protein